MKKIGFDKAIKKVEGISNTVELIMQNRLIIAIFLIVDGITFMSNPNASLPEMARNIIILMLIATFSVLITNLSAKAKDVKTIVMSIVILILGIIFYIYPDLIASYIELLLSLFIIYDGAKNIATTLDLSRFTKYTTKITDKYKKLSKRNNASKDKAKHNTKFKEIDDSINEGLEQQKDKLFTPLKNIVNKTSKFSKLYIVANIASIILGIILLVFPDVSMMLWGLIFVYTGMSNLIAGIHSMELMRKIKERKFKEIIFDGKDNNKSEQAENKQIKTTTNRGGANKNKQVNTKTSKGKQAKSKTSQSKSPTSNK